MRLDYFAVFDGHAGEGAAVYASNVLHEILIEKLREVQHLLLIENSSNPRLPASLSGDQSLYDLRLLVCYYTIVCT